MREIKFRAWDLDNGVMYHSDREQENGEGLIIWKLEGGEIFFEEQQLRDREMGGEHYQYSEYGRPNQALMQFTGLKDKNGAEVYEGDILNGHGDGLVKAVWRHGETQFDFEDGGNIGVWELNMKYATVIGNIYENPELLNAQ